MKADVRKLVVEEYGENWFSGGLAERIAEIVGAVVVEGEELSGEVVEIHSRHGMGGEIIRVEKEVFDEHEAEIRALVEEENEAVLNEVKNPQSGMIPDYLLPAGAWVEEEGEPA